MYPCSLWNHYGNDGPRTTNHLGGWHRALNYVVGKKHVNVFQIITHLQNQKEMVWPITHGVLGPESDCDQIFSRSWRATQVVQQEVSGQSEEFLEMKRSIYGPYSALVSKIVP